MLFLLAPDEVDGHGHGGGNDRAEGAEGPEGPERQAGPAGAQGTEGMQGPTGRAAGLERRQNWVEEEEDEEEEGGDAMPAPIAPPPSHQSMGYRRHQVCPI